MYTQKNMPQPWNVKTTGMEQKGFYLSLKPDQFISSQVYVELVQHINTPQTVES